MIFEKLGLCGRTEFVSFVHDLKPLKKYPGVVVTDLRFGTIPVKLYRPETPSSSPRTGIVFYHGGGTVLGSLSKRLTLDFRKTLGGTLLEKLGKMITFLGLKSPITTGIPGIWWVPGHSKSRY